MSESSASSPCPGPERLAQHVDGELDGAESEAIARHLAACSNCRWLCSATHASQDAGLLSADAVWSAAMQPLPVGARLGRYRIDGVLGRGGMGIVYEGFDERLGRDVAIKCVHAPLAVDRRRRMEGLRAEARTLAATAIEDVVEVFDIGETADQVFIVMERVQGVPLRRWCSNHDAEAVIARLGALARALEALHTHGWVHGDVKPDNVMVDDAGQIRLLDFGLSRALRGDASGPGGAGTPAYMAPEQLEGAAAGPRADQYAWAVTAFEMLTGRRPHDATTLEQLRAQVQRSAAWPDAPGVPRPVKRTITRALDPDPSRRHPTMSHVASALRRRLPRTLGLALTLPVLGLALALPTSGPQDVCLEALPRIETGDPAFDDDAGRWRTRWADAAAMACAPEAVAERACLRELGGEFVALAPQAQPDEGDRIALRRLSAPARCLEDPRPLHPEEPALAQAREELAQLRAALSRKHNDLVIQRSRDLEVRLLPLHAPAAMAEVLLIRARAQTRELAFEDARASLRGALAHAQTAGADDLATEIWLARVSLEGRYAHDRTAADRALRFAEAALQRAGRPPALEAHFAVISGSYLSEHLDQGATGALELAVQRTRELHGADGFRHAEALNALGVHRARTGDLEEAERLLDEATQIYATQLGAQSQKVAMLLVNRANVALIRRDPPAAVDLGTRALSLLHPDAKARSKAELTIGDALSLDGEFRAALPHLREALRLQEADMGPEHPLVLTARISIATTLRRIGDPASLAEAHEVIGRARAYAGAHDIPRMRVLLDLEQGLIAQARGDRESAARYCQLALDAAEQPRDIRHARGCVDASR